MAPELAGGLPNPVPVPVGEGRPDRGYPFSWLVYPWLEGTSLDRAAVDDWERIAEELAAFVLALERQAPEGGPPPTRRGTPMGQFDATVQSGHRASWTASSTSTGHGRSGGAHGRPGLDRRAGLGPRRSAPGEHPRPPGPTGRHHRLGRCGGRRSGLRGDGGLVASPGRTPRRIDGRSGSTMPPGPVLGPGWSNRRCSTFPTTPRHFRSPSTRLSGDSTKRCTATRAWDDRRSGCGRAREAPGRPSGPFGRSDPLFAWAHTGGESGSGRPTAPSSRTGRAREVVQPSDGRRRGSLALRADQIAQAVGVAAVAA